MPSKNKPAQSITPGGCFILSAVVLLMAYITYDITRPAVDNSVSNIDITQIANHSEADIDNRIGSPVSNDPFQDSKYPEIDHQAAYPMSNGCRETILYASGVSKEIMFIPETGASSPAKALHRCGLDLPRDADNKMDGQWSWNNINVDGTDYDYIFTTQKDNGTWGNVMAVVKMSTSDAGAH